MKILVIQSGGPTAVMNQSLFGVISRIKEMNKPVDLIGVIGSFEGVLRENFITLDVKNLKRWKEISLQPGGYIGSSRFRPNEEDIMQCITILQRYNIKHIIVIGGNGSMSLWNCVATLDPTLSIVGIPQTIDNDISHSDLSPGYLSAVKVLDEFLEDMYHDTETYPNRTSIEIVETMGRNVGWLAASCQQFINRFKLQQQVILLIPEVEVSINEIYEKIDNNIEKEIKTFIIVAEGVKLREISLDNQLNIGQQLKKQLQLTYDAVINYMNMSIYQRCSRHTDNLDCKLALSLGEYAVSQIFKMDIPNASMVLYKFLDGKALNQSVLMDEVASSERGLDSNFYNIKTLQMKECFTKGLMNKINILEESLLCQTNGNQ